MLFQLDESRGGTACVAEVRAVEEVVLIALVSSPLCEEVGTIRASERMSGHGVNRLHESSVVGRFFRRKLYTLPSGRPLRRLNGDTLTVKCFCIALSISFLVSWGCYHLPGADLLSLHDDLWYWVPPLWSGIVLL